MLNDLALRKMVWSSVVGLGCCLVVVDIEVLSMLMEIGIQIQWIDDTNPFRYPEANEVCDGGQQLRWDCRWGVSSTDLFVDADGDAWSRTNGTILCRIARNLCVEWRL